MWIIWHSIFYWIGIYCNAQFDQCATWVDDGGYDDNGDAAAGDDNDDDN